MSSLRTGLVSTALVLAWACTDPPAPRHTSDEIGGTCGNGVIEGSERCDDGDAFAGDGCSAVCSVEAGWVCRIPGQPCEARLCEVATAVNGAVFLRGNYIEVGMHENGAFGSAAEPPAGWHARPTDQLGYVSDPDATGWTNYHGDFFTPGSPEEGWSLEVGGTAAANTRKMEQTGIAGSWGAPSCTAGGACGGKGGARATWTSDAPIQGVSVQQVYTVIDGGAYVVVDVTLTNTTGAPLTDVYYARNVDPDNDQARHGEYETTNTIISQPDGAAVTLARVEATQNVSGVASALSLVADDARARVTFGGFSNYDPSDIWNGVGLSQSGTETDDHAVSIAFKVDLPAGGSTSFRFAYNLEASPEEVFHCVNQDGDGDGIVDAEDPAPADPAVCGDADRDLCDDCALGVANPLSDGVDFDTDGLCNRGDPDNDNNDRPDDEWYPVTSGDFDADGDADLVWRNVATGRVIVWLMTGTEQASTAELWAGDPTWVPIAAADFNADGRSDLVWRKSNTGRVIVWLMNGPVMTSSAVLWTGDPGWVPIAAADLNADGKPDLVWRYAPTGRVIVWLMNGTTMSSTAVLWTGDPGWLPVAAGDFNADGRPDLVWRHAPSGRVIVWLMNGTTMSSSAVLWTGDPAWVPYATGDFGGDAGADLVWRKSSNGRVIVWLMNGTTMASGPPIWE